MERQDSVQRFLELIRRSHRGKFKVYIGMSAGVGKTCRMLQEARQLLDAGLDLSFGPRHNSESLALTPPHRCHYETDGAETPPAPDGLPQEP